MSAQLFCLDRFVFSCFYKWGTRKFLSVTSDDNLFWTLPKTRQKLGKISSDHWIWISDNHIDFCLIIKQICESISLWRKTFNPIEAKRTRSWNWSIGYLDNRVFHDFNAQLGCFLLPTTWTPEAQIRWRTQFWVFRSGRVSTWRAKAGNYSNTFWHNLAMHQAGCLDGYRGVENCPNQQMFELTLRLATFWSGKCVTFQLRCSRSWAILLVVAHV